VSSITDWKLPWVAIQSACTSYSSVSMSFYLLNYCKYARTSSRRSESTLSPFVDYILRSWGCSTLVCSHLRSLTAASLNPLRGTKSVNSRPRLKSYGGTNMLCGWKLYRMSPWNEFAKRKFYSSTSTTVGCSCASAALELHKKSVNSNSTIVASSTSLMPIWIKSNNVAGTSWT